MNFADAVEEARQRAWKVLEGGYPGEFGLRYTDLGADVSKDKKVIKHFAVKQQGDKYVACDHSV